MAKSSKAFSKALLWGTACASGLGTASPHGHSATVIRPSSLSRSSSGPSATTPFRVLALCGAALLVTAPRVAHAQRADEPAPAPTAAEAPPPAVSVAEPGLRWSLDARAGFPVVRKGDTRLAGDLSLGVAGKTFGVDLRGSAGTYEVIRAGGFAQTDRAEGGLDAFVRFGSPAFEPEIRLTGGAAYYGTTISAPGTPLADDDSVLGRGALMVGFRGETPSLGYALLVGGGAQVESRSATTVSQKAGVAIDDSEEVRSRFEARARLRAPLLGGALALRFIEEASLFTLRRDASALLIDPALGGVTQTGTTVQLRQVESRTRLALDAPMLGFGPLLPTVFIGLDIISQRSDVEDTTSLVPLAGVGLVHQEEKRLTARVGRVGFRRSGHLAARERGVRGARGHHPPLQRARCGVGGSASLGGEPRHPRQRGGAGRMSVRQRLRQRSKATPHPRAPFPAVGIRTSATSPRTVLRCSMGCRNGSSSCTV